MNINTQQNQDKAKLSSVDTQLTFNEKGRELENFAIHTMKKDLQNSANPQPLNNPAISEDNTATITEPKPIPAPVRMDSRQRTSPFLSQNIKKEEIKPLLSKRNAPENISYSPTPHTPSNWGKLILTACAIFIFFAAGMGGYYFWMNKKSVEKNPVIAPISPAKPVLALDKPNYFNIETDKNIDISAISLKYIQTVQAERPGTPVEFIIVDKQNNPVSFKKFAANAALNLPEGVINRLGDNFSLFIYLDENQPRLGLAIDSNDLIGSDLKNTMIENEFDLIPTLTPLFLTSSFITENDEFNTSYYGGAEIRYSNINSDGELSLDYTIFRDKLLFGTSKMTVRSVIDYLTAHSQVKGIEDVIENISDEELEKSNF